MKKGVLTGSLFHTVRSQRITYGKDDIPYWDVWEGDMRIDVIIPVYRPGKELKELLERLERQTVKPDHIILINTEKALFDEAFSEEELYREYSGLVIRHISKKEFDHGGTRRMAVEMSEAEVFVLFTQDALPADTKVLENLTGKLQEGVAVSYGRQLPRKNSGILERISRDFNYPAESVVKGMKDMEKLGIKTFFCSNVCAAYRRDVYEKLGGFVEKTIFNEDMIYAGNAVKKGYLIQYAADARVYHSHDYSCMQQFHRNFDLGVSQAQHPEIFAAVPSESEGKKLVSVTVKKLADQGAYLMIPAFFMQCAAKYAGYLCGKKYRILPKSFILWASDNKSHWK